jgi:enoyl-CoA hydratase/carnithine racemase
MNALTEQRAVVTVETPAPHIRLVTFRRPEARNAINGAVAQALDQIVRDLEQDPEVLSITAKRELMSQSYLRHRANAPPWVEE